MRTEKIFNESGKGYWMEGFGCLRAEGENRPSRPGHVICYAIEGNVVDRVSAKNGKGWCDDVSHTLNTQDRHAVCFAWANSSSAELSYSKRVTPTIKATRCGKPAVCIAIEGNGARPSHMGKGWSEDGTMYTLNTIEQHSVCYGISRSCLKGGDGSNGGMPIGEDVQPAMTANGCGAVAYAIENHPGDSRISIKEDGIVQTLTSRIGTGGGNTPMVLEVVK